MISEWASIILGAVVCLVIPAMSMAIGIYIGRHGMPIEIRWRPSRTDETD